MSHSVRTDGASAGSEASLRDLVYKALMSAISEMGIYDHPGEPQLHEHELSHILGVSRTPVREALAILEHQGFVRCKPRRGVFVIKKNKLEIVEMVYACAGLESMAVRLACAKATEAQLGALCASFGAFYEADPSSGYDRYFEARWRFCRHAATLAQCQEIQSMLDHLLLHLRSVHEVIFRGNVDLSYLRSAYVAIIAAIEQRDAERACQLVLERGFRFARDIEGCADFPQSLTKID